MTAAPPEESVDALLDALLDPPDGAWTPLDTLASSCVSQTSSGVTIASERRTRSQSKRLCARLVTVSSLACCVEAKSANDFTRAAWALASATCDSRLAFSALRSEIWLPVSTTAVMPNSAAARTATTT